MKYTSTRNQDVCLSGEQAILKGISQEGGLFVPISFPRLASLETLLAMNYKELALHILKAYLPDLGERDLRKAVDRAYDDKFSIKEVVKLRTIDEMSFLELYHGPTLAFKDMALTLLPHLLKLAKEKENIEEDIVILTATSGDTGKAALEGFSNVEGVKIIVFYPEDGVSSIQKLQMITQEGGNTLVVGIKGNFDHAQNGVKNIFNDGDFSSRLKKSSYILSSANSINIGRLIPQISYYVYSYLELVRGNEIEVGEEINVAVPTGNFGNILAAYYAKSMGLPINKLICASNENKVLTEFFTERKYDINRDLILSSSPSMDILISSNLERLLFHLDKSKDKLVEEKMGDLREKGYYDFKDLNIKDFYGNYANEEEVADGIRGLFDNHNYLIDPHTAVAYEVYKKYKAEYGDNRKVLIASTASPFKFGEKVAKSIGLSVEDVDEFQILENLSTFTKIETPKAVEELKEKEVIHKNTIDKEDMLSIIEDFLKVGGRND